MTTKDKLREKILSVPPKKDITYSEAESFLLGYGFIKKPPSGGSHVTFEYPGIFRVITLPSNTKTLKRAYIKNIRTAIEDIENE